MSFKLTLKPDAGLGPQLLHTTNLMLGLAPAAGLYHTPVVTADARSMIRRAVDEFGVAAIDTAPWYGCGKSEIDLGAAIAGPPAVATRVGIFTKVGRIAVPRIMAKDVTDLAAIISQQVGSGLSAEAFGRRLAFALQQDTCYAPAEETRQLVCLHDCTYHGIMTSYAQSMARLQGAKILGLRMHDADTEELFQEAAEQGGLDALRELRTSSKVANIGLGLNDATVALRYIRLAASRGFQFDSVMIAGCWNLLNQSGLELLSVCEELGIAVHLGGAFGAGFLHGQSKYLYAEAGSDLFAKREGWLQLCAQHNVTLQQLALAFAFRPACVSYVAVGCAAEVELERNVRLAQDSSHIPLGTLRAILTEAAASDVIRFDTGVLKALFS